MGWESNPDPLQGVYCCVRWMWGRLGRDSKPVMCRLMEGGWGGAKGEFPLRLIAWSRLCNMVSPVQISITIGFGVEGR